MTAKVAVATPIYCKVPALEHPELPIAALDEGSSPADCVRAYAASIAILKSAVSERDSILSGCAAPSPEPGASPAAAGS